MHYNEMSETEPTRYDYNGTAVELIPVPYAVAQNQNTQTPPPQIPAELIDTTRAPYRLGPGDVITVVVWEHPELTTPLGQFRSDNAAGQVISPDGTLYFPYVGIFQAAGRTAAELRTHITESLSQVLKEPQVDVKITDYRSQRVFITGEVKNPGIIPITDNPLTLADALHKAGGFLITADAGRVELVRGGKTHTLDIAQYYKSGLSLGNVHMHAGDQLRVPSSGERKVYLMGEVGQASAIPRVKGRLSLVQAMAEAKGINNMSAAGEAIYVIRFADTAGIQVYHLNARNPLMLAVGDQFALQPQDVVYVAATGLARWNRFVNLILPTASLLNGGTNTATNIQNLSD